MMRAFLAILIVSPSLWAQPGVVADVKLNPAGSFKATSNDVSGEAVASGGIFKASNIIVKLKNFKTGLALRDKHMTEKYLEVGKYPEAVLVSAEGKGGKGKATIRLHGVEREVAGSYQVSGNELVAEFPIKLSEFNITGIKYMGVGVNDDVNVHVTVPVKGK
jgi:polyisoprenoid-binding protein YceI